MQAKYGATPSGGTAASMAGGACAAAGGDPVGGGKVDVFISENRLDDGAARALRAESPDVQEEVVSRGSLVACTNPSSAVMGRIREARLQRHSRSIGYGAMGN